MGARRTPGLHSHCPAPWCGGNQPVEVAFEREPVGVVEVNVPERYRRYAGQDFVGRYRSTAGLSPLAYPMKLPRVVGDDGVGEQCERAGDQ